MKYETLVSTDELQHLLSGSSGRVVAVDCRFSLADPGFGRSLYRDGHIPGAVYAHLDDDLAGTVLPGVSGRHPLPDVEEFAERLGRWGIDNQTQVVAYDDAGGALAARLWWLLHWLGHKCSAVLDGGYAAWTKAGCTVTAEQPELLRRSFVPTPNPALLATTHDVESGDFSHLVDSRSATRYRGEEEPFDSVAGHIPGALNRAFTDNLEQGKFRDAEALRAEFSELLGEGADQTQTTKAVFYCGSGVTAAHNLLAMAYAGLEHGRLYNGSWSEWIADGSREVATGEGT